MNPRFSFSRFLLFVFGLWVLVACTPVTPTLLVVTEEPGAPVAYETAYPPPPTSAYPPPGEAPQSARPPDCVFGPGTPAQASGPELDSYVIGEPQVILTRSVDIVEWLPDGEHLLILERLPDVYREAISLFDVTTGNVVEYAQRDYVGGYATWLESEQAIIYAENLFQGEQFVQTDLWMVSQPFQSSVIAENVDSVSAYLDENQQLSFRARATGELESLNLSTQVVETKHIDPELWIYPKFSESVGDFVLQEYLLRKFWFTAPHPSGSPIAFSTKPWLFLVDTQIGVPCEINFEGLQMAYHVQWSPDGRYLAMITDDRLPGGGQDLLRNELRILDMLTGEWYLPSFSTPIVVSYHWAPDSQHLLVNSRISKENFYDIILVDVVRQEFEVKLTHQVFEWENTAFSSNGVLAINCPGPGQNRVCLITTNLIH